MTAKAHARQRSAESAFTLVKAGILQRKCACVERTLDNRELAHYRTKADGLQRRAIDGSEVSTAPPIVNEVLRSPGRPLEDNTRGFMEARFGHDFSGVRVHADNKAAESTKAVNANAFTVAQHIVFAAGGYAPHNESGCDLLSHELVHVLQQRQSNGRTSATEQLEIADSGGVLERETDAAVRKMTVGESHRIEARPSARAQCLQRQPAPGSPKLELRPPPILAGMMGSLAVDGFALESERVPASHLSTLQSHATELTSLLQSYPGGTVIITGHTDSTGTKAYNVDLGRKRAESVRRVLVGAGVPEEMISVRSAGEDQLRIPARQAEPRNRRVEIQFRPQPMLRLGPSLSLTPPSRDVGRPPLDLRPQPELGLETDEERLNRILREPPPAPVPRRSFNELFWKKVGEQVDDVTSRLGVPRRFRSLIRQGARALIERGANASLDAAMDAAGLDETQKEAIRAAVRAAAETRAH